MKSLLRNALLIPAIALTGALGLALAPSMAAAQAAPPAQGEKSAAGAEAQKPDSVGGVTVQAPRPPSKLQEVPADKKAAFDAEVAKAEAWKRYRQSKPSLDGGTLGLANDYPGLQSLLPQTEPSPPPSPAAVR